MEQISKRVAAAETYVRMLVGEELTSYKKGEWVALVRARSMEAGNMEA